MTASLKDFGQLLFSASPTRVKHAAGLWGTYWLARSTGRPKMNYLPVSIGIEPTTSCNLRCPECPSGLRSFSRPTGMIDPSFFNRIIDQVHHHVGYLTFYFQGEPYLHPKFLEMIRYAGEHRIYTSTSTNAHYLDDDRAQATVASGLDRLIISIDGISEDSYQKYRIGGRLEKVLEGARKIVEWKRKLRSARPYVVFQFVVFRHNEHEIESAKKLALDIGVDELKLKTAQIYNPSTNSDLIPGNSNHSRYRKESNGRWVIKNDFLDHCWKMWHSCVVTWDGSVVPCCFDKDAQHVMGSLKDDSFDNIWFGERYQQFRGSLFQSRAQIEICRNCTEGTKGLA